MQPSRDHGFHFVFSRSLSSADDGAGVAHAASWWCRLPSNKADHRFLDILPNELCRYFLGGPTDLANHDDRFRVFVLVKQLQGIHEIRSYDRVATDSDTR